MNKKSHSSENQNQITLKLSVSFKYVKAKIKQSLYILKLYRFKQISFLINIIYQTLTTTYKECFLLNIYFLKIFFTKLYTDYFASNKDNSIKSLLEVYTT